MDESFSVFPPDYKRWNYKDKPMTHQNTVRVFRTAPDRVSLQIRTAKGFATASIPFDVAKQIAAALEEQSDG